MRHRITIKSVRKPRYCDTLGDWTFDKDGNLTIAVTGFDVLSDKGFLIALHELVEVMLCVRAGITQDMVDAFDFAYKGEGEPGDDPGAPYREQHRRAAIVEHIVANFLGLTDYGTIE